MLTQSTYKKLLLYEFENFKIFYNKQESKLYFYDIDIECGCLSVSNDVLFKKRLTPEEVGFFIKPTVSIEPYIILQEPTESNDALFWQNPCCTEYTAYNLHSNLTLGSNIDCENKIINTYIGVPWATFIDKKAPLGEITKSLGLKIERYKKLTKSIGYTLCVHTVCQSIHWKRILDYFYQAGITDVHASHYSDILPKNQNPYNLKIHSWHLYAVNVENPKRNRNIIINKPIHKRQLFASFKGAHMIHYLSDIRNLLINAHKRDKIQTDIFIEISDEWHFNKEVFNRQVQGKMIEINNDTDIKKYNELLSDSIFALCPEGAGINTIRLWEALAIGTIPVLMISDNHIPMLFRLHPLLYKCCILIFRDNVIDIFKTLRNISKEQLIEMQNLCRQVYLDIRDQTTFQNQYNTLFGLY